MSTEAAFSQAVKRLRKLCPDSTGTMEGRRCEVLAFNAFTDLAAGKQEDPRFPVDGPKFAYLILLEYFAVLLTRK